MISRPLEQTSGWNIKMGKKCAASFWGLFIIIILGSISLGQDQLERVEEVRIIGNRRILESTITYYIQTKANDPYNENQILRDYRSLLNTNFFEDAKVLVDEGLTGKIVIFEVKEKPIIRRLIYEGMSSFKESDVLEKFFSDEKIVRDGLSGNPNTPIKLLNILKDDNDKMVRMRLAENEKAPSDILEALKDDDDPDVSKAAEVNMESRA